MSHLFVNSILPADTYNRLIIDHEATERAELLKMKHEHLPALFRILTLHGVADFLELHLLHRHFALQEGEAVVHRTFEIPASEDIPGICVDIAKAMYCPKPTKSSLVPLLWMVSSNDSLVAYEYGLQDFAGSHKQATTNISSETWSSLAKDISHYVRSAGIADVVSLKDKRCINGGEYVVPSTRVLFRIPKQAINLQPGSGMLESGWKFDAAVEPDASFREFTDGHVTKTRQTSGGTVAHYHTTEEIGVDAFNPNEVPLLYTDAMWAAAKSENFWSLDRSVGVAA
ncbi:MAG: hypothetical protein Q9167_005911 [Letrouitia subvulpina]